MAKQMDNRRAIVTGACGGIGTAICRLLRDEGAEVLAADIDDGGTARADALAAAAPGIAYRRLDVTDAESIAALAGQVAGDWGRVDLLVNNAGAMLGKSIADTALADADRLIGVNLRGTFLMIQAIAPLMTGPGAAIVNMSSGAAQKPIPGMCLYSASKAAVSMLSKAAALELAPIRVNAIEPGTIDTDMPRTFLADLTSTAREAALENLAMSRALKRLGRPEEVASLVLFLASDKAAFITGSAFVIDGGRA